jgi:phosphoribosylformylglycinamidine cyclo-ligase
LIRKILEAGNADLQQSFAGATLGEALLQPTRIYVKSLLALMEQVQVHALAHITGGGIVENLPRVMPSGTKAVVRQNAWPRPEIFNWLQTQGGVQDSEMWRTFNCGVGMIVCVSAQQAQQALELLTNHGEQVFNIGQIEAAESGDAPYVQIV